MAELFNLELFKNTSFDPISLVYFYKKFKKNNRKKGQKWYFWKVHNLITLEWLNQNIYQIAHITGKTIIFSIKILWYMTKAIKLVNLPFQIMAFLAKFGILLSHFFSIKIGKSKNFFLL